MNILHSNHLRSFSVSVLLLLLWNTVSIFSFEYENFVATSVTAAKKSKRDLLKEIANSSCKSNDFKCRQNIIQEGKEESSSPVINSLYLLEEPNRVLKYEGILDRIYEVTTHDINRNRNNNNNKSSTRYLDEVVTEESKPPSRIYVIINAILQIIYLMITTPVNLVVDILTILVETLVYLVDSIEEPVSVVSTSSVDNDEEKQGGEVDDGTFINDLLKSLKKNLVSWSNVLEDDEDVVEVSNSASDTGEDRRFLLRHHSSVNSNIAQLDSMLEKVKNIASSEGEKHYTKKHEVLENIVLYSTLGFVESKGDLAKAATWSAMAYGHQVHF